MTNSSAFWKAVMYLLGCAFVQAIVLNGLYISMGEIFHIQPMESPPLVQTLLMMTFALFIVAVVCVFISKIIERLNVIRWKAHIASSIGFAVVVAGLYEAWLPSDMIASSRERITDFGLIGCVIAISCLLVLFARKWGKF